ncbi:MAG: hypothetical protein P4L40_21705 [Terracidiphilus sp.]|nr:hypothetical protein [Terracidiphilus sp.]
MAEKDKAPVLRAVAVLEWTGDAGKPKKARLIPITIFDGGELQDGSFYMARPQPLGLSSEVEYVLKQTGKGIGLFDVENAGQEQGIWVGYGKWKPMPAPKRDAQKPIAMVDETYGDRPVLHRKHHADDPAKPGSKDAGAKGSKDSDEPTLHRKDSSDTADAPAPDPDRPTLHKVKSTSTASDDSGQPKQKKGKQEDIGHVENLPEVTDPDRPRLKRGKSEGSALAVTPSLMGLPADMEQTVAVSDGRDTPEHPWVFHWANHDDELQMKAKLEAAARTALGLDPPPAAPAPKAKAKSARAKAVPAPPAPPPLAGEQFHVFELAYGAGATLVLSAHTDAPEAEQKFVTLVAQPDFYGGLQILLKNVTDARHLDDTPRLRLVDAVDAEADNRGELLFEARGATERHFVLYRVLRGRAELLFASAPASYVAVADRAQM